MHSPAGRKAAAPRGPAGPWSFDIAAGAGSRSRNASRSSIPAGIALLTLLLAVTITATATAAPPLPRSPNLGEPITPEEAATWNRTVTPDGTGLPAGSGTVEAGERLYSTHCAACHGPEGVGDTADELAGGRMPLDSDTPDKTIGTYWPYATTLFDFIRRSMPATAPGSLADAEVYALTAYLLWLNQVIGRETVMDAKTLAAVKMPNREGFVRMWPEER